MLQRVITGAILLAVLALIMLAGGWVVGAMAMLVTGLSLYEEYRALQTAGHRPIIIPTWAVTCLAVPMTWFFGVKALGILLVAAVMITVGLVIFRRDPQLTDAEMSLLPLLSVVLPGLCMVSIAFVNPVEVQRIMLSLVVLVPVACDTAAYFGGTLMGKTKLCPDVSPKKTVAGAVAGMLGAMFASCVIGVIAYYTCRDQLHVVLPHWWTYVLLGLMGGFAAQVGDLFASLVKRHCGVKDFSNLFPGHGGMLDRTDSILFMALVVFCVCLLGNRL